jgi:acyl-CoA oxidase
MNGRLSMQRARTVGTYINRLLAKIRPHAVDLVDAFGYGQDNVRAAIATGAEEARQTEARSYFRAQRASGDTPLEEKALPALEA